jgi:hypothetical protein
VGLIKILLTSEACTAAAFGLAELFGASFEVLLRVLPLPTGCPMTTDVSSFLLFSSNVSEP